jgi:hypothetical protein
MTLILGQEAEIVYISIVLGRSKYDPLRSYVTGSNDATPNEVVQIMAVPLVGTHHGPEGALGHLLVDPPGNITLIVWISTTIWHWWLRSHKLTDQSLPCSSIMTPRYYYGLPGMTAGERSYGGSFHYLSCLPRIPLRCRKPSSSTL